MDDKIKAQIIGGNFSNLIARQKQNENLELGELLVADSILLQVVDIEYGSQISQQNLELISGMNLEHGSKTNFIEQELRNYKIAVLKPLANLNDMKLCKSLPDFFSVLRSIEKEDLKNLVQPENPLFLGNLRSGSLTLDLPINVDAFNALSHHILIAATTGRGKSNLVKNMLWDLANKNSCGILVLDPHDEYYGRNGLGLKDTGNIVYYTMKNVPNGTRTLKINISKLKPYHFQGSMEWTEAQEQTISIYYKKYKADWIENIFIGPIEKDINEATLSVVKRKLRYILSIKEREGQLFYEGVFDKQAGQTTVEDIINELEKAKVVVVDTSPFSGNVEILIGSIISHELLNKYKYYKFEGIEKPVVSIVLEEAPRVIGKEVLEHGSNVFSTIAREGRKFNVGLIAITQLPSLIPREILANMNTKIILGIEMKPERQAIIESASQDLSSDDRSIASLDKGEAIVTSNFVSFATPIRIPLFKDFAKPKSINTKMNFEGLR